MSSRTAKFALVAPMIQAKAMRTDEHYSPPLVMWATLAFCLSVWAIVILAVEQYV